MPNEGKEDEKKQEVSGLVERGVIRPCRCKREVKIESQFDIETLTNLFRIMCKPCGKLCIEESEKKAIEVWNKWAL